MDINIYSGATNTKLRTLIARYKKILQGKQKLYNRRTSPK